jgi:hypothetical protein
MVIHFKHINKVCFPVYALPSGNWHSQDGLLFLDGLILDDKNMPGDTLGIRRLQSPHKNIHPLKHQIDNFRGMIKSRDSHFIDTNGRPFIYEKTQFCKLKYYKIKSVKQKEVASVLWLHGVTSPFVIPRPPASQSQYAGVLHYGALPWILYEYSEEPKKDTRRKV